MNGSRRQWLALTAAGLLLGGVPIRAKAAAIALAPDMHALREAVAQVTGGQPLEISRNIVITAQSAAENRRLFPIAISSGIEHTEMIALFVEDRAQPLVACFNFGAGAEPYAYFYLRMWESTTVHVVVKSGKRFYTAQKHIVVPDTTPCG